MTDANRSTTEQLVAVPALQSLISGLAGAATFGVMAAAVQLMLGGETDWLMIAVGGLAVGVTGFLAMWVLLMLAHWPRRERPVEARPAPMRMDVAMPVIRPAFSAHDALRFVRDALVMVNGEWQDKDGGSSQREMARKGWTRDEWELAVTWLLDHGILEWRNPIAHQQGTRWNIERLNRFVGRE